MANATKRGPPDEDTDDESQEEDVYRGDGPSSPVGDAPTLWSSSNPVSNR